MGEGSSILDRAAPDTAPLPVVRRFPRLWMWWAAVAATHVVLFGPIAFRAEFDRSRFVGPNLFRAHTIFTGFVFDDWWRPATPGYLWQVTARVLTEVSRTDDLRVGGMVATWAFYAVFGIAIFEVYRRCDEATPLITRSEAFVASIVVAMLESPAAFIGWTAFESGRIFFPLYLPYAPTTIGSLGVNVFLLLCVAALLDGRLTSRQRRWLPAMVVLAAVAKPTMIPLTVAVLLGYAVIAMLRRNPSMGLEDGPAGRTSWKSVMMLVVLPAVVVLIPQFLVTATKVQYPGTGYDDRGGWVIHPLSELRSLNGLTFLFWLVVAFPVAALIITRRGMWADTAVRIAVLAASVGVAASLLFERTGSTWKGDMLQLPEAAIALLMVFMPKRALELRRSGQMGSLGAVVLLLVFVPYAVAGVLSWGCHVGIGCPLD